jgi:hypothetical protein
VIYIVSGRARLRWGEKLEFVDEAGPGDFVYVPPYVPHQELNARADVPVEAVLVRSGQEPIVVNLDIPSPEDEPEAGEADPFHSGSGWGATRQEFFCECGNVDNMAWTLTACRASTGSCRRRLQIDHLRARVCSGSSIL